MYHAIVIVQNQCKHLKSVHVSANFYGEYQPRGKAKHVFGIFKKAFLISAVW